MVLEILLDAFGLAVDLGGYLLKRRGQLISVIDVLVKLRRLLPRCYLLYIPGHQEPVPGRQIVLYYLDADFERLLEAIQDFQAFGDHLGVQWKVSARRKQVSDL